ncbi:uncharacterized protein TNCV_3480461 [Trichonephila clavipes]|nr:uncharacterized protein TNCV_3480461 [Trichonephila clavipes]
MRGDLPRDRIVPPRPFEKVGLDYAGPIIMKPNLKRPRVTLKSYIAIFICFSTKATHLEVVSDLTTEAFLACLRRFIARRSKPSVNWSDNATNFKGARNILNPPTGQHSFFHTTREASKTDHTEFFLRPGTHQK